VVDSFASREVVKPRTALPGVIDGSWWWRLITAMNLCRSRSAVEAPRIRLDHAFSLEAGLQAMPFVPAVRAAILGDTVVVEEVVAV
jgi:hypothetical protein